MWAWSGGTSLVGMGEKWKKGFRLEALFVKSLNAPDHRGEFHIRSLEAFTWKVRTSICTSHPLRSVCSLPLSLFGLWLGTGSAETIYKSVLNSYRQTNILPEMLLLKRKSFYWCPHQSFTWVGLQLRCRPAVALRQSQQAGRDLPSFWSPILFRLPEPWGLFRFQANPLKNYPGISDRAQSPG